MPEEFEPDPIDDPELIAELNQALLEHAQDVAQQIEKRVRHVTGDSDSEILLKDAAKKKE